MNALIMALLKLGSLVCLLYILRLIFGVVWKIIRVFRHSGYWELPGDRGWDLLRLMFTGSERMSIGCRVKLGQFWIRKYPEKIGRDWIYLIPGVQVYDSKAIMEILVAKQHNFEEKSDLSFVAKKFLGDTSMILTTGELHRRHRTIASTCFKSSNLRHFSESIVRSANNLVEHWNDIIAQFNTASSKTLMNEVIYKPLSCMTLDIIMEVGLGIRQNSFKDPSNISRLYQLILAYPTQKREGHRSSYAIFLDMITFWLPTRANIYRWKLLSKLHASIDEIVRSRKLFMQNLPSSRHLKSTYLDILVSSLINGDMTRHEVRHELMTILIAGHETTSNTLSWALMLLSKHPEVQEKARLEVQCTFKNRNEIDYNSVEKLKYLNCVICETLRLYPVICGTGRRAREEDSIMGYTIPANVNVILQFMAMQRDPDVWENPNDFMPSRFMKDDSDIPWASWMPFGEGPHKCMGYQMALLEMKICLATLLNNFKFRLSDEKVEYEGMLYYVVMRSLPNVALKIEKIYP